MSQDLEMQLLEPNNIEHPRNLCLTILITTLYCASFYLFNLSEIIFIGILNLDQVSLNCMISTCVFQTMPVIVILSDLIIKKQNNNLKHMFMLISTILIEIIICALLYVFQYYVMKNYYDTCDFNLVVFRIVSGMCGGYIGSLYLKITKYNI